MALLNKDQILGADDLPSEDVDMSDIPGWDGEVRIRALTGAERDRFETSLVTQNGKSMKRNLQNMRARLVALCVVDSDGERVLTDADAAKLGGKSAAALDRLFDVAQRLSGLSNADVTELAEVFGDAQSASSTSD